MKKNVKMGVQISEKCKANQPYQAHQPWQSNILSLDPPRIIQESLLGLYGADFGPNLSQVGSNLGSPWTQLEPTWSQPGSKLGPE